MSPITPSIISRDQHSISRKWISPNAVKVLYKLKEHGYLAYLVGGGVRDLLLGREPKDFDIATDATPGQVKRIFRTCRLIGKRFRLAHVHFHNEIIEVATFRSLTPDEPEPVEPAAGEAAPEAAVPAAEAPEAPPPKPRPPRMVKSEDGMILRDNVFGTPEEDALRRDFTVNALFYSIADFSVIDYVGGMEDLRSGRIRIIGDPVVRFTEDPVRMVRAVRFASLLGFEIEERTYEALLALKDRTALASPARMYEEVLKLFLLGEGEKTYQMLRRTGLFGVLFPMLNQWVDTESDGFPHIWIGKALEWVDACVSAGRKVEPHILFGLMFGQYIEEQAAAKRKQGVHALEAVSRAVTETLSEQAKRVMIPKKVGLPMRDMYWNQYRFSKREGRHPIYFLRRPGFTDAYEYLRFTCQITGEGAELLSWWKQFIEAHPASAEAEVRPHQPAARTAKPKRRRRRRGGRGRSGVGKPET